MLNRNSSKKFKGYTIPGPIAPGASGPSGEGVAIPEEESLDAISGHFKIFQFKKGHRFSTDDLLVAWYGTSNAAQSATVLDLGSGIGSVAMIAAWRLSGARFVTIEAQEASYELAKKSAQFNGLASRMDQRLGDFRKPDVLAPGECFDLVLGSPPYFPADSGFQSDHPQKLLCRFEIRGDIADYCQTAAQHLNPGGVFACVFPINPPHQEARVLSAAEAAGLQILKRRNIILKEGNPPLLAVFLMILKRDLPDSFQNKTVEEHPLVIRAQDGAVHPEYSVIKLAIGFPP